MANERLFINGVVYDFSSIEINLDGTTYPAKSINYKDSREAGKKRGNRSQIVGVTRGTVDAEGDLEMYENDYRQLLQQLAAKGKGRLEATFNVTVVMAEDGSPTSTDRLIGCHFKSNEFSRQEGSEALMVKLPLFVMQLLIDGVGPIDPKKFILGA